MKKTLNIVLIIVAIITVAFTVTCLWLFYLYQSVPDMLVDKFYTTIVGELLISGLIKIFKIKEKNNDSRTDDSTCESLSDSARDDFYNDN